MAAFFWVFPLVILGLVAAFVGLWLWTVFLETARPASTRLVLHGILVFVTFMELIVWYRGNLKDYVIVIILFCNFWGTFDAILRYPIVHDLDSFFTLKLIVVIACKTMTYAIGFRAMGRNAVLFLACLFGCVWGVPLLYVMALPIGDSRMIHSRTDCRDMDVLRKAYHVFFVPEDGEIRHEMYQNWLWWRDSMVNLAVKIPGVAPILVKQGLVNARSLRKVGREI
eukprot:g441.t1